jgi:hypothetical protein
VARAARGTPLDPFAGRRPHDCSHCPQSRVRGIAKPVNTGITVITEDRSAVERLPTRIDGTPGGRLDREDSVITNAARLLWRS